MRSLLLSTILLLAGASAAMAQQSAYSGDAAAAYHAADIRAALERRGRSIGGYDVLIAGHARSRGLIVVTGNRGEFDRVEGLRCEDWG